MKPRLLKLCAFGPFAGPVEVDFRRLQGQNLVLIEGPTGAGKTTLLDAMCFALFGGLPGARAEAKQPELRCTQAQEDLCQVSFDFEFAGQAYRARRVPTQERPKKRGEGTVEQAAQAFLYALEGDEERALLASGVKEVTQHVERLIGLSMEQFKQVLLLPQGEFREFLLASSDAKAELLQRLFKTGLYEDVQDELRAQRRKLEDGARGAQARRGVELQRCGVETVEALEARVLALEAALAAREAEAQEAEAARAQAEGAHAQGKQLAEAFAAHARALAEREAQRKRAPDAARLRGRLAEAERARALLAPLALRDAQAQREGELRARRTEASGHLREAEAEREAVAAQMRGVPAQRAELARLTTAHSVLAGLVDTEAEATAAREAARAAEARAQGARQALTRASGQAERLRAELHALDVQLTAAQAGSAGAAERTAALKEAEARAKERRQLEELRGRIRSLRTAMRSAEEAARRTQEEAARADAALLAVRAAREAGLASELAASLTPGHPCPVCGSAEHPAPALPAPDGAGPEQVQAAETAAQRAAQAQSEALAGLASARSAHDVTLEQGKALAAALGALAELPLADVEQFARERVAEAASAQAATEALRTLAPRRAQVLAASEAADGALAAARDAEAQASREAEGARHHSEELGRRLEAHLLPGHTVASQRAALEREQVALASQLEALEARERRVEEGLAVARAALERAAQDEAEAVLQLAELDAALLRDAKGAGFADVAEARRAGLAPEGEARARGELEALERALAAAEQSVQDGAARVEGRQAPDLAALAQGAARAAAHAQGVLGAREAARAELTQLQEARARIGEQDASYAELEGRLRVLGRLAEMVAGENALKMSLERFVLASRMDEVAVAASERLLRMSRGRYALQRTNDVRHRGRQSGLDLKVLDRHAGTERFVHSLSGGEMFLASLSLALGLADVVTRRSGGVQLDALFIDEGFGTLDDETLDLVMRTLEDLRAGGRLVGLISHVSELKERIPTRLTVSRGPRGSTVALRA
ncbi:SMC family ATPase [Aggregicoccus sp. 17bor-14]|uniref:AAA family ATPase n=1 Tax=Myxococcaceae TaxID=31 RepID=UPI00129D0AD1|nr:MULTISPECIES: SMC family ATPase [Myxococcaceae]MBF5042948.1 SMC family ATPase [Simulacricoccus sp. 17bor-14]MRI88714.1 SMC family ATPase [Aggregicoccus sp. 17bor-14]